MPGGGGLILTVAIWVTHTSSKPFLTVTTKIKLDITMSYQEHHPPSNRDPSLRVTQGSLVWTHIAA